MSDEELKVINENMRWFEMMQQMMVARHRKIKINKIRDELRRIQEGNGYDDQI